MLDFIGYEVGIEFKMFSITHLLALVFYLGLPILLIYIFRDKLRNNSKFDKRVRYSIAILGILFEVILHIWFYFDPSFDLINLPPFYVCSVTLYVSIYSLFKKDLKTISVVYFLVFGPLLALVIPSGVDGYSFDHFRFHDFFFCHCAPLVTLAYFTIVHSFEPTKEGFNTMVKILAILIFVSVVYNSLFGTNYLYLFEPEPGTPIFEPLAEYNKYVHAFVWSSFITGIIYLSYLITFKHKSRKCI